jgi:uncharacterized membrane protein
MARALEIIECRRIEMQVNLFVFAGVTFLHDLFTAVWIGGLIATGIAVLPAAKSLFGLSFQTRQLMRAVQRRLRVLVYVSIVGLIITGALMSRRSPQFQGLLSFSNPYSVILALKHLLVIIMVAVALVRSMVFSRVAASSGGQPVTGADGAAHTAGVPKQSEASAKDRVSVLLLLLNIILGIGVLVLSAAAAALAAQGGKLPL